MYTFCLSAQPEGVERMRAITFPVFLSDDGMYNQNVTLDFSPWTLADVVQDSRRVAVKITGKTCTFSCHTLYARYFWSSNMQIPEILAIYNATYYAYLFSFLLASCSFEHYNFGNFAVGPLV